MYIQVKYEDIIFQLHEVLGPLALIFKALWALNKLNNLLHSIRIVDL